MFHFLEYPFSRGFTHIISPSAYDAPDFDAGRSTRTSSLPKTTLADEIEGFMNDKRDMAPMAS